jgi:hypothetical protein
VDLSNFRGCEINQLVNIEHKARYRCFRFSMAMAKRCLTLATDRRTSSEVALLKATFRGALVAAVFSGCFVDFMVRIS